LSFASSASFGRNHDRQSEATGALLRCVNIPQAGSARVPSVQLGAQARHWKLEEMRPSVAILPLSRRTLSEKVHTRQDIVVDKLLLVGTLSKFLLQSDTSGLFSGGLGVRHDRQ